MYFPLKITWSARRKRSLTWIERESDGFDGCEGIQRGGEDYGVSGCHTHLPVLTVLVMQAAVKNFTLGLRSEPSFVLLPFALQKKTLDFTAGGLLNSPQL